jgi:D-arabinose 1-dehydrogenase-like Zn-dependent alcohol dehydrogenase
VLLRVEACGVCHSDLHIQDGFFDLGGGRKVDLSRGRTLPLVLGHEIAGRVVALGEAASGVRVGDRRVVYPWIGCGTCALCGAGEEHACARPRALGVTADGGFADHVLVPHTRYLHEYGDVPTRLACTYACSGLTAYGALARVRARAEGRSLLVVGAGGVGTAAIAIARATLQTEILVADVDERKREAARSAGAAHAIDAKAPDAAKEVLRLTGGGAAAAIDFVGSESSASFAVSALGKGGRLAIVGLFGGAITLPVPWFPLRDIGIEGSYVGSPADMAGLMALVRAGRIAPIPLEGRPLEDAQRSLDDLRAGRIVGRVVLEP